ncbi:AfsR/SARP family transcriptional regulator [Actinomadura opuntiae]|uniref:AfsR/SARP family transcriptional regulator n=1 Tax=Actinomadura sp. OS1-43 TaxID=604315 RepID=UPI00255AB3C3|nr:AfsR/SARP family transcriptional regulator [Actinomadura sp. OS1-43]MDL4815417.1 AfsR/SARP family transcriptional regulator [Actinomadura sp. OS1-43]
MRYEILGPLRVADGERVSTISAPKIETLLAALLVRCDQIVTTDQLMMEIWGDQAPRRATAGLHVYISQLRKFLDRPGRAASPIETSSLGYVLRLGDDEFDFHDFLRHMDRGRERMRRRRFAEAAASFENALGLWHGSLVADLRHRPVVDGFFTALAETRLECTEMLIEAQLELGRHRELAGRLWSLIAEHPLREAFYRQLMLALYRSESQAAALHVYQLARRTLNTELGVEPCRLLQSVHQAILEADEQLELAAAG